MIRPESLLAAHRKKIVEVVCRMETIRRIAAMYPIEEGNLSTEEWGAWRDAETGYWNAFDELMALMRAMPEM